MDLRILLQDVQEHPATPGRFKNLHGCSHHSLTVGQMVGVGGCGSVCVGVCALIWGSRGGVTAMIFKIFIKRRTHTMIFTPEATHRVSRNALVQEAELLFCRCPPSRRHAVQKPRRARSMAPHQSCVRSYRGSVGCIPNRRSSAFLLASRLLSQAVFVQSCIHTRAEASSHGSGGVHPNPHIPNPSGARALQEVLLGHREAR